VNPAVVGRLTKNSGVYFDVSTLVDTSFGFSWHDRCVAILSSVEYELGSGL